MKPAAVTDGHTLAECYESLRQERIELSGRRGLHGHALLMFKGMAAWMRGVGEVAPSSAPAAARVESRLPTGIEENLINLVASMTLATARGSRP